MPSHSRRSTTTPPTARQLAPVPLTVSAVEIDAGSLSHLRGNHASGQPWRLSVEDATAAIRSRRYSLGVRVGRERIEVMPRREAAWRFEARDHAGKDLLADLPVVDP